MSSSPPGVSRSSDGNYNSGELALCRHTNFSRGWISSRWCRADWRRWRRPPQSCNMNGNSPAETGRLVLRLGSFRLLAPDPSTTNYCHQKLQERKTCASLQPIHPSLSPQVHKKSDVDGYRQANSGVPVTPSKLGRKVWGPDTPIGVLE